MTIKPNSQELKDKAQGIYQTGDYPSAALAFADASTSYAGEGDLLMAAEMKNNESVAHLRAKQPQDAYEAARGTDIVFAEAGDIRRQGIALTNQASAHQALKQFKEAVDMYTRAGDAFEKAGEIDMRVEVMQLLSVLYLQRLRLFDAIIALQSGLIAVKNPTSRQRFMKKLLFIKL
jgi:tetratricopeptide (TPR) repeat protein